MSRTGVSVAAPPTRPPPRRRAGSARSPGRTGAASGSPAPGGQLGQQPGQFAAVATGAGGRHGPRRTAAPPRRAGRGRRGPRRSARREPAPRPGGRRVASSVAKRVLPIPGSPPSRTPPLAGQRLLPQLPHRSSSGSRPTKMRPGPVSRGGMGTRAGAVAVGVHATSQTASGPGRPLSSTEPRSVHAPPAPGAGHHRHRGTRIWPGRAAPTSRAASTTGVPKTSPSSIRHLTDGEADPEPSWTSASRP